MGCGLWAVEPRVGRGRPGRTTPYTGGVSPHQFDEDLKIGLWLFSSFIFGRDLASWGCRVR